MSSTLRKGVALTMSSSTGGHLTYGACAPAATLAPLSWGKVKPPCDSSLLAGPARAWGLPLFFLPQLLPVSTELGWKTCHRGQATQEASSELVGLPQPHCPARSRVRRRGAGRMGDAFCRENLINGVASSMDQCKQRGKYPEVQGVWTITASCL